MLLCIWAPWRRIHETRTPPTECNPSGLPSATSSSTQQDFKSPLCVAAYAVKGFGSLLLGEPHRRQRGDLLLVSCRRPLLRVRIGPECSCSLPVFEVALVLPRDLGILRVIRLWRAQQRLQRYKSGLDGKRRAPLVLQDIQADRSRLARNVRVPQACCKLHLGGLEWVGVGNHNVKVENTALEGRADGPLDRRLQVPRVIVHGGCRYA
mmetsp:Transcript_8682/g.20590  ORF Transcript_8682/g.20590 Transcript_8682/m.20590 type:complete len:208 (+) Transcript_8682:14-637(+)